MSACPLSLCSRKCNKHDSLPLQSVLTDVGWRVSDGVIQCKFSRSIYTPQDPVRFSLNNSYYLFVAHGTAEYGELFNCINDSVTVSWNTAEIKYKY